MIYLAAFPYLYTFVSLALSVVLVNITDSETTIGIGYMGIIILSMIAYIIAIIVAVTKRKTATAKRAFIVKAVHIPAYIINFIIGVIGVLSVFGLTMAFTVFFGDVCMIILSGIYMTGVKKATGLEKFLGFIFVADVIVALKLMVEEKR